MKELHYLFLGMLLGLGAAIPIGPINLEVIRRHLRFGGIYGFAFGIGACLADLTYLALLTLGTLTFLTQPLILKTTAIAGSIILIWFGIMAFRTPAFTVKNPIHEKSKNPPWVHTFQSYTMTLINPFTILFWSSVSTEISLFAKGNPFFGVYSGIGVLIGTISWIIFLNLMLHWTRHFLPPNIIHRLNQLGGVILIFFAFFGMAHAFHFL